MSVIQTTPLTPADLLAISDGNNYELVDGHLVEINVGVLSSLVEANLIALLGSYCKANQLGPVFTSTNGIQCFAADPRKIRRPDVSFVKAERFAPKHLQEGFLTIAPDLAVEVISANDLVAELDEKTEEYLAAGIPLVWVIDPEVRTVVIHRADGTLAKLRENDELTGENVIPGFRCKVAELFPAIS
jgi:Uma2 family endonuclease